LTKKNFWIGYTTGLNAVYTITVQNGKLRSFRTRWL